MALTDKGVVELQELYHELRGKLDGYISELDKLILTEDGEDVETIDSITELMVDSIEMFEEDMDAIFDAEFRDDSETFDDEF